jgi:hypothetical protein
MTETQAKPQVGPLWTRIAVRLASFLLLAALIGAILNRVSTSLDHSARPAGFVRGVLQGALMPMSLPNLLAGRDITIYSQNNTGVTYKIGYTSGVNGCGALFFGVVFWRFNKLRRTAAGQKTSA